MVECSFVSSPFFKFFSLCCVLRYFSLQLNRDFLVLLPFRHNILYVLVRLLNRRSRHKLRQVPVRVWKTTRYRLEVPLHFSSTCTGRYGWPHLPIKNSILHVNFSVRKNIRSKDSENEKNEFWSRRKKTLYGNRTCGPLRDVVTVKSRYIL